MKKSFFLNNKVFALVIALLGSSFSTLSAHNNENGSNANRITLEQRAKIEQAGVLHNKMLDAILANIWQEIGQQLSAYADAGLIPLYSSCHSHLNQSINPHIKVNIEQMAHNTIGRLKEEWELGEEDTMVIYMLMQEIGGGNAADGISSIAVFTAFQADYFNRFQDILQADNTESLDHLLSEIAALELQIEQNAPTVEEALPLLYATNITRHSLKYWSKNFERWGMALHFAGYGDGFLRGRCCVVTQVCE